MGTGPRSRRLLDDRGPGAVVLRPFDGFSASRKIDVLSRPENLRRRSVRTVVTALTAVVARLVRERRPEGPSV